jgi:hypothetical protein
LPLGGALLLSGCLAKAAVDVVTLPVKVAGQIVETGWDAATTTQQEADEDRGKAMRKAEEKAEKERRKAAREARRSAPR